MSIWSRMVNVIRGERLNREIGDEFESHIAEAIEDGRDPAEARAAFGLALSRRDESRDIRVIPWLASLRADAIFGWRQLIKNKVTSTAAVLSLALAVGACTGAFRLIDALLLRPLPVAHAEQLYAVTRSWIDFDGKPATVEEWAYPSFRLMRAAVKGRAELIAVSYVQRMDLTYKSDQEMEKANLQYVSGWMFGSFGLRAALGRLLTENDDLQPRAHPYAVLSYDYWSRRFARDPQVVGRTFRMGDDLYQIVGVGPPPFTGTETGTVTDIFIPAMMHPGATLDDWSWHRTLARLKPGVAIEPIRARLDATSHAFELERSKGFSGMRKQDIDKFLAQTVVLRPAAAGASNLQNDFRVSLLALGVLAALVLLIACVNVANLMTAQAMARTREMALRVSIGAGRWRLVQLVLVEGGILAFLASALGGIFAWWSAPFVVGMINPPDNPARLALPADWRVLGFGVILTGLVMLLLGLTPALRASAVKPAAALKGGDQPHSRRRLMHTLIGAQVAFCVLVLFVTGLFAATFQRLSHRPMGFSSERLLTLNMVSQRDEAPVVWDQLAEHLRGVPGVQAVAMAGWPLLDGNNSWNNFISLNGAPPSPVLAHFLAVSPGWIDAMKIPLIDGRDFRADDTAPGAALVNETFAKQFFNGADPVGKSFVRTFVGNMDGGRFQIVGLLRDAPYRNIREPILPVAFVPLHVVDRKGGLNPEGQATFIVRTASENPMALASILRREVPRVRPEFRVSDIRPQADLVRAQTVRERLLAMLALFFAAVALLLAAIGLYGVLDYSVLQRRREIGIRMAIGAPAATIARLVTVEISVTVLIGALAGIALGMASARYIETLLYQVKPTDAGMLAAPSVTIVLVALLAALPAVCRAVHIDPAAMLRSE
ncbi:MAG TPA: ABC transporter permease [Bryobacteraceae bacterium]|nr:ABC transporter permease [Bryobacteraceae bacterium]